MPTDSLYEGAVTPGCTTQPSAGSPFLQIQGKAGNSNLTEVVSHMQKVRNLVNTLFSFTFR